MLADREATNSSGSSSSNSSTSDSNRWGGRQTEEGWYRERIVSLGLPEHNKAPPHCLVPLSSSLFSILPSVRLRFVRSTGFFLCIWDNTVCRFIGNFLPTTLLPPRIPLFLLHAQRDGNLAEANSRFRIRSREESVLCFSVDDFSRPTLANGEFRACTRHFRRLLQCSSGSLLCSEFEHRDDGNC